jgi:hypothetical protein
MALSFPSNPTIGQLYQAPNGTTYVWDGIKWAAQSSSSGSGGSGGGSGSGGAGIVLSNNVLISSTATSLNFVGDVVTATSSGTAITINFQTTATTSTFGLVKIGPTLQITDTGILNSRFSINDWQENYRTFSFSQAASVWAPQGLASDIDAAIIPQGGGANVANIDGTKRGQYATDWQKLPGASDKVASGDYSIISGGSLNKASALHSVVVGGNNNLSDANYSTVLGGRGGSTNGITGATIISGAAGLERTNPGTSQAAVYTLGGETYDNNVITLTTDGTGSPSASNQLTLKDNSAVHFRGMVIAKEYQKYRGEVWTWTFEGAIRRDVGSTTTDFAPSAILPIINLQYGTNTSSNWAVLLDIDNQHGALVVKARGGSTQHIRWVCRLDTVEVSDLA